MITKGNELLKMVANLPYFGFDQLSSLSGKNSDYMKVWVHRQINRGEIVSLKRGVYVSGDFYRKHSGEDGFLQAMSSIIKPNSYVSCEFVLQKNNILTQATYNVSCITTTKTANYHNDMGSFNYQSVKPVLFVGYDIYSYLGIKYGQANKSKALFDYLYLKPLSTSLLNLKINLCEELRLNLDEFSHEERKLFEHYVELAKSTKMKRVYKNFKKHIWTN